MAALTRPNGSPNKPHNQVYLEAANQQGPHQGGEVPALVFAVLRRSSAARAAHRELRSLLRLFRAS
ncbi:hypothetical protein, partial [Pseudomonas sp. UBA6699]|uniref:hypothetical protein n=1 Tax=Pseudomonas sp. UBA6699 TaxID=1947333 RepID=UPI00257B578B